MRRRDFFALSGSALAASLASNRSVQAGPGSQTETHLDFTGLCLFRDPASSVDVKLLKSSGHVPLLVAPYESVYWDGDTLPADFGFKVAGQDFVAWQLKGAIKANAAGSLDVVEAPHYYQEQAPRSDGEWRFVRWLTDLSELTGKPDPDQGKLNAATVATVTLQGGTLHCLKPESHFKDVIWQFDGVNYERALASHIRFTVSGWALELVAGAKHVVLTSRAGAATVSNLMAPAGPPADDVPDFQHFYDVYDSSATKPKAKKKVRALGNALIGPREVGPKYCPPGRG